MQQDEVGLSSGVAIRHSCVMTSLTDTLCTRCGLCCDGSLFADVELTGRAEATGLEILGLEVEDDDSDGELLVLPCLALHGKRCSIYAHRPQSCRTFECRLLQDAQRGAVSVERALVHISEALKGIGRAKQLIVQLGQRNGRLTLKERCAEALVMETGRNPEMNRKRAELEATMSSVESIIRQTFLPDPKSRKGSRQQAPDDSTQGGSRVGSEPSIDR